MKTPENRIKACNNAPFRRDGEFVLYWMIANRRAGWNFSLQRAVEKAEQMQKPLVVLEALRCGYKWASDRLHKFIIDGMADNEKAFAGKPVLYYPYIEPEHSAGKGLLAKLAERACVVVTDDFPCFMLPHMVEAAARQSAIRMEKVDSNGLLPMRATNRVFPTAYTFRQYVQKNLRHHLAAFPQADPLEKKHLPKLEQLPGVITKRWPQADLQAYEQSGTPLGKLPIDHSVRPVDEKGGTEEATMRLQHFLDSKLDKYAGWRNEPQQAVTSELSPYLHFGHISAHEIFHRLALREQWAVEKLAPMTRGNRKGWWGMSAAAEAFLDELITWREVGYNMCTNHPDYDQYESLPDWAIETLEMHAKEPRAYCYSLHEFEHAQTHDPLWNASQNQLVREGRIHNYLRMLWGKKILEWTASPRQALAVMIELNNKYALDGRNPNSNSGIFWVLGRYDRAWGPERPIFGKIRYMSSDNTARKVKVHGYIEKYAKPINSNKI